MDAATWTKPADWQTPAGRMLKKLVDVLPRDREFEITVFGSAPLQIMVDPLLLSGGVDIFSNSEDLEHWVQKAGLGREQSEFHIQVCSGLNFRTSPQWGTRAQAVRLLNCTFRFPHPIDILIAEPQMAVDLFRPGFDKENAADLANNTHRLWPLLYGREIDVRKEIIAPALAKRRAGYDLPTRDYKRELKEAAASYTAPGR
jgi:hypothetical protein